MDLTPLIYQYDTAILTQSGRLDQLISLGILVWGTAILVALPHLYIWLEVRKTKAEKEDKKLAIGDLIKMKEIQGEIEREMREALIRSELRSKEEVQSKTSGA